MGYQNGVSQNMYLVSQSLEICISWCHLIKPLSVKLQKKDQDIVRAYAMTDDVKDSISDLRNNMDVEFSKTIIG
jgi:hypothetical protein